MLVKDQSFCYPLGRRTGKLRACSTLFAKGITVGVIRNCESAILNTTIILVDGGNVIMGRWE